MTNKPHTYWAPGTALGNLESRHNNAACVLTDAAGPGNDVALIRLTDHERLQAEAERLQADHETARAADKARIAELTEVLRNAREMVADWGAYASEYFREKHSLAGDLARIDAVLNKEPSQ